MDEEDHSSVSSGDSDRENDHDEVMEDAEDADNEPEEDNNEEEDEAEGDGDGDAEGDNEDGDGDGDGDEDKETQDQASNDHDRHEGGSAEPKSTSPGPESGQGYRPKVRPEALTARLYDIIPTMAAPQATSINALAITPDLRFWFTGGSDGYIRKYDGPGTINGKLTLTVAQKHPFVDSVTKAGILMSYWENEEPPVATRGGAGAGVDSDRILSPVYSLAVPSNSLWLLSGLESGGINLQSVRHDEGKKISCLQRHSNAVSTLTLAQDEKSVLSGGWDKNIFDWDLNTGQAKRSFDGSGGQISAVELRPASGDPIPAEADEPLILSDTMVTNNGLAPLNRGFTNGVGAENKHSFPGGTTSLGPENAGSGAAAGEGGQNSPTHESLFGGGSDAGSLFGETAGEQPFGHDDDDGYGTTAMGMMPGHEGGMDHSADMAMTDMEPNKEAEKDHKLLPAATEATMTSSDAPQAESMDTMDVEPVGGSQSAESQRLVREPSLPGSGPDITTQPGSADDVTSHGQGSADTTQAALKRSQSPMSVSAEVPPPQYDPSQMSTSTFLSAAIDGPIRLWDRRVPQPVARIGNRSGVPPWCMSACWSPDGNMVYAGRRNGTVEEYDVRNARRGWEPGRVLRFPAGSGAVSAVKPMVNGRHLVWYVSFQRRYSFDSLLTPSQCLA